MNLLQKVGWSHFVVPQGEIFGYLAAFHFPSIHVNPTHKVCNNLFYSFFPKTLKNSRTLTKEIFIFNFLPKTSKNGKTLKKVAFGYLAAVHFLSIHVNPTQKGKAKVVKYPNISFLWF